MRGACLAGWLAGWLRAGSQCGKSSGPYTGYSTSNAAVDKRLTILAISCVCGLLALPFGRVWHVPEPESQQGQKGPTERYKARTPGHLPMLQ